MNTDERQMVIAERPERDYSLHAVPEHLVGAAFEVHKILGYGFLERVYQRAMQVELQRRGIKVELEPSITVKFKGVIVGDYAADLLVENKILVELKTDAVYQAFHEVQLLNELRGAELKLVFLINFGREKVEFKRMVF